ncbi:hypothetical protein [Micromonospora sp. NPDC023737]|uniref:hypothetical protein n=1 Tax=unclassified Micromonospora TaxID=2617518 RepID=UPI00340E0B8A
MSKQRAESPFRPLDFIRGVMADDSLDTREKAVLVAAAIGTDNASFKVKRSLSRLAESAKCDRGSMSELVERPQVARYFAKVDRPNRRRVDIWLRQEPAEHVDPVDSQHVDPVDMSGQRLSLPSTRHVDPIDVTCRPHRHDMSTPSTPSALYLPPSASTLPIGIFAKPSHFPDNVEDFTPAEDEDPWAVAMQATP